MKIKLNKAIRSSGTRSRRTLSSTPGSRAIGGNAYRWSLGHICVIASSPRRAGCVRENQSGQWDVSRDANRSTCAWPNSFYISSTTSGWSLHSPGLSPCLDRMSAPIFWAPGMQVARIDNTSFGTTGGFGTPVCKVDVTANLPGDLCRRPPMCCLSGQAHGGPWDLLGNSWEQEIQPTYQAVDVPWEMMVLPQTLTRASLRDRSPAHEGGICR